MAPTQLSRISSTSNAPKALNSWKTSIPSTKVNAFPNTPAAVRHSAESSGSITPNGTKTSTFPARFSTLFSLPDKVLAIIPLIVGIVIVLHGINDLSQAVTLCKNKYDLWWLALLFGVVTLGFGAFLIYRPIAALDTAVMMIGIFLIYDGLSDIWIVSRIYRSAKQLHQELEAVDAEAREIR